MQFDNQTLQLMIFTLLLFIILVEVSRLFMRLIDTVRLVLVVRSRSRLVLLRLHHRSEYGA
jgi:hypothetical protein